MTSSLSAGEIQALFMVGVPEPLHLLGMGRGVEVLEPLALRCSLLDYAEQVISVYSPAV
jgi:hypothetical protein